MSDNDYSGMTDDDFSRILGDLVSHLGGRQVLDIAGVYEIVSEELNNDILDRWKEEQEIANDILERGGIVS